MSGGGGCEPSRGAEAAARRALYVRPRRSSVLPPAGPARPSSFAPPTILPAPVPLTHILSPFVGYSAPPMLDMRGVLSLYFIVCLSWLQPKRINTLSMATCGVAVR